jgi:hypothetical protein
MTKKTMPIDLPTPTMMMTCIELLSCILLAKRLGCVLLVRRLVWRLGCIFLVGRLDQ